MSIAHRTVSVLLLITLIGCFYLSSNQIGFSSYESGDKVEVSAGTHPAVIVWAVLVIFLYFALLSRNVHTELVGPAKMWRRSLSVLIDFSVVVLATSSVSALIPLEVEARRVGHFEWSFARDYMVSSDSVLWPLTFLALIELFLYAVYPLTKGKQTIGEYVMRIKVLPPFGVDGRFTSDAAMKRVWYSFLGAGLWPYTLAKKVDRNGQTWYDRKTNCNAVLVDYKQHGADITP
jgi:uncharacterized RDD family membrane protein YckC